MGRALLLECRLSFGDENVVDGSKGCGGTSELSFKRLAWGLYVMRIKNLCGVDASLYVVGEDT